MKANGFAMQGACACMIGLHGRAPYVVHRNLGFSLNHKEEVAGVRVCVVRRAFLFGMFLWFLLSLCFLPSCVSLFLFVTNT
jgi:hypothetical protein